MSRNEALPAVEIYKSPVQGRMTRATNRKQFQREIVSFHMRNDLPSPIMFAYPHEAADRA